MGFGGVLRLESGAEVPSESTLSLESLYKFPCFGTPGKDKYIKHFCGNLHKPPKKYTNCKVIRVPSLSERDQTEFKRP